MKEIKLIVNYNGNFAGETVKVSESAATELIDMGFAQEPETVTAQEPEAGEPEPKSGAAPEATPTNKAIQPGYKTRKPKK